MVEHGFRALAHQAHHLRVRALQRPVVLRDLQGLPLGLESLLAVWRHASGLHGHLLLHDAGLVRGIVLAQHQAVDGSEPKHVEEVPGDGGDPGRVEALELDTALQHRLEPQRQREWDLSCDEAGEMPVDPAAHHHHGDHRGHVALDHFGHHARVGHRVRRCGRLLASNLEEAVILVVEVGFAHVVGLLGQILAVLS